jgi:NADH-quinone oxidoreductase subunit M
MATLILIIIPIFFSLLLLLSNKNMSKFLSVASAGSSLIFTLIIIYLFRKTGNENSLLLWHTEWLPQLGADCYMQIDGINIIPVLLTALITPFIFLTVRKEKPYYADKTFYILLLLMQAALFGVFVSKNLFLFYVFWELALIPIFFIALLYGAKGRQKITFNFFIYTLFGSLFMLVAIIFIGTKTNTENFNIYNVYKIAETLTLPEQYFIFGCFFLAFAIKIPIFPFHTWQPNTYVNAPVQGTMMLAGLMLKMATFALIYWLIPMTPAAWHKLSFCLAALAVISTVYAALMALAQQNFKRLLAYASMSHVGLIAAGILSFNLNAVQGSIVQMLAHGINVVAIFYIYDIIQSRTQTDDIKQLGGIRSQNKLFSVFFLIVLLANIALPLSNAFIGEFMLLYGIFQFNFYLSAVAGLSIIFGAAYMLLAYHRMMHGETNETTKKFAPLNTTEIITLSGLAALMLLFGVFPNLILKLTESDAIQLIEHVKNYIK